MNLYLPLHCGSTCISTFRVPYLEIYNQSLAKYFCVMVLYSTTLLESLYLQMYKSLDQKIGTKKIEKLVMYTDVAPFGLLSILWYNEGKQNLSQQQFQPQLQLLRKILCIFGTEFGSKVSTTKSFWSLCFIKSDKMNFFLENLYFWWTLRKLASSSLKINEVTNQQQQTLYL